MASSFTLLLRGPKLCSALLGAFVMLGCSAEAGFDEPIEGEESMAEALSSAAANAVVAHAQAQADKRVPYSWGGGGYTGPTRGIGRGANTVGFDCSALMQYAFYQGAGKRLPRTTYDQYNWSGATRLAFSHRSKGDLIFYNDREHVALYAGRGSDGTEYIIDAPHTGTVVQKRKITAPGTPMSTIVRVN